MQKSISIFFISVLLMSAGTRWIQFEYCSIQSVFNSEDTLCTCTLTLFMLDSKNADSLPVTNVISINGQMCDMICDINLCTLIPDQLITTDYQTKSYGTARGFLPISLKPPELL